MNIYTKKLGFTLVEIMIVVGIIAILAGIFLVGSSRFRNTANIARVKADLQKIEALQEIYYTVNGHYASAIGDLEGQTPIPPATAITYSTNAIQSCASGVASIGMEPDPYCLTR